MLVYFLWTDSQNQLYLLKIFNIQTIQISNFLELNFVIITLEKINLDQVFGKFSSGHLIDSLDPYINIEYSWSTFALSEIEECEIKIFCQDVMREIESFVIAKLRIGTHFRNFDN